MGTAGRTMHSGEFTTTKQQMTRGGKTGARSAGPARVLVLDDHAVVRAGLRAMLEADGRSTVVLDTADPQLALASIADGEVDVAIVDVLLGASNGVEFVREARSRNPEVGHVMLTSFREEEAFFQAAVAGAAAFVIKDRPLEEVADVVAEVAAGGYLLDAGMVESLASPATELLSPEDAVLKDLTERERTIVMLIAEGCTNQEIASQLFLAEKTVRNYVSNVLAKLDMRNRTQIATHIAQAAARRSGALVRAAL